MRAAFVILLFAFILTFVRAELWRKRALDWQKLVKDTTDTNVKITQAAEEIFEDSKRYAELYRNCMTNK